MQVTATASAVLQALGDPQRRKIVQILRLAPSPVRAIADQLPISRPAVSRHLRQLKQAGLVLDRPSGTRRIYHLHNEGLQTLREYLDAMWQDSLRSFATAIESDQPTTGPEETR